MATRKKTADEVQEAVQAAAETVIAETQAAETAENVKKTRRNCRKAKADSVDAKIQEAVEEIKEEVKETGKKVKDAIVPYLEIQLNDKAWDSKEIIDRCIADYGKRKPIANLKVYFKPSESTAYYVVNDGEECRSVKL